MKKIRAQQKQKMFINKKEQEPIGNRIAKAVYAAKKISERIFGYIAYDMKFVKATYEGKTLRPAKITALEKGIVGILLVNETDSFERIGAILGLDVVNDKAERTLLRSTIDTLKSFNAIEGDDSCLALTDGGRTYADKGERPETYSKSFDIFVDTQHPTWFNIKDCLGYNIEAIEEINTSCDNLNLDLEQVKEYAEYQAQDVHYPQDRYILESAVWKEGHEASYKVYVCFVQNVATKNVRAFVFDENQQGLNELIAEHINNDESLMSELLTHCIRLECENDDETEVLEGEAVDTAIAEIPEELKMAEQQIVQEEEEAEHTKDDDKETKIVSTTKAPDKVRLHKKALYDSLSFEVELQKIFKEDAPDEIWLISPWIRRGAFLDNRGPLIENFLSDENKRVFVAYSEPAIHYDGKPMIDEEVKPGIKQLEEQFSNFFFVQLPEFHLKNVIEVKGDQKILFSGSFNVLSFMVSDEETHIRREEMALAHHTVAKKKYAEIQLEFARIYANRIREQLCSLSDESVSDYKNARLEYFQSIDNPEIQKLFMPIEELLEEKILSNKKRELSRKLTKVGQELIVASNMKGFLPKDKKRITSLLTKIEEEMNTNGIEDPSMRELLDNNKTQLNNLPERKIFPNHKDVKVKPITTMKPKPVADKENAGPEFFPEEPEATIEGLSLYVAQLCCAFINKDIKRKQLNSKLLSLINDDAFAILFEMVGVADSKSVGNAFDLTLGINGYLFKFPALLEEREVFESKQKRAKRILKWTNSKNINTIITELS